MPLYPIKKSFWKRFLDKIKDPSKEKRHSLLLLNISQFLGVINDNVFKFVMAFLLIQTLGQDQASGILSATGAIYVIPFLLFSSSAGILADKFSKQRLLLILKGVEILIMAAAVFAFYKQSMWMCYSLLFLLAAHSAMFGPSKYGIIPELVPSDKVFKANGLVTSFTYLAIIIGTFLASFLTELTQRHFTLIALFCLILACIGFVTAYLIHKTPSQGSTKSPNFLFVREIYHTLRTCESYDHLLPSIFGSAFFLFLGAFTQLNIIPYAIQALHFNEVAGGYLFLSTALGIALGSVLAGKISKTTLDLAIPCFSGFGIVLSLFLLAFCSHTLIVVVLALFMMGVLGGVFIVPFDTFIQLYSENQKRGQTIAAANFLSFAGVLIASCSLFLFNHILGLSSSTSFGIVGVIALLVNLVLCLRLSRFVFPFIGKHLVAKKNRLQTLSEKITSPLILEETSWKNIFLLLSEYSHLTLWIPARPGSFKSAFLAWMPICRPISSLESFDNLLKKIENSKDSCLCIKGKVPILKKTAQKSFFHFLKTASSFQIVRFENGKLHLTSYENSSHS